MVRYLGKMPPRRGRRRTKRKPRSSVPLSGGMTYYSSPIPYQRGRGLGGVLVKLFKQVVPFLKRNPKFATNLKRVGKGVAQAGISAAQAALEKKDPFGRNFKRNIKKEARKLVQEAIQPKSINNRRNGQSDIFS